ncbi:MAG: DUF433 domain-containing protein [Actinomycetota bacterium]|nr:DUF433 domain-containing protein [Actinomycetota bacterium]
MRGDRRDDVTEEHLGEVDRRLVLAALAGPRGFYSATRASQLSGIPERTVYYWANHDVLVPDHMNARPKSWSYRDLVLLRLIAFLRQHRVDLGEAAQLARRFRRDFGGSNAHLSETKVSAAEGGYAVGPSMDVNELSGQPAFEIMVDIAGHFDLMAPIDVRSDGVSRDVHVHGVNLVHPSPRTAISPWVMSGEPVVTNSRISTGTLLALHENRGMASVDLVELYPSLTVLDVDDALEMERKLRVAA